jgi:hypothetical protein
MNNDAKLQAGSKSSPRDISGLQCMAACRHVTHYFSNFTGYLKRLQHYYHLLPGQYSYEGRLCCNVGTAYQAAQHKQHSTFAKAAFAGTLLMHAYNFQELAALCKASHTAAHMDG